MFYSEHDMQDRSTAVAATNAKSTTYTLQAKLKVGPANDVFEQEADTVANAVMRTPQKKFVQQKCGEQVIQRDGPVDTGVTNEDDDDPNPFKLHATFTPTMHGVTGFRPKMDFMPVMGELNYRGVPFAGDYYKDARGEFLRQYEWYKSLGMGHIAQNAARVPLLKYIVPDLPGNDPDAALANLTTSMAVGSYLRKDYPLETERDESNMHVFNLKTFHFDLGGGARRKCSHCEEEDKQLQRKEAIINANTLATSNVERTVQSGGVPLDASTRSFMEHRFGYSFGNVRIHNDDLAHRSSEDINAHAYTVGNHISFAAGKYQPQSDESRHLLAHELTHVVQQNSAVIRRQSNKQQQTVTTPIVKGGTALQQGGYNLQVSYIAITVLPDVYNSPKEKPHMAHTYLSKPNIVIPQPGYKTDPVTKKITSFTPYPALQISLTVETNYAAGVSPTGKSDYGFGTRPEDIKSGNTSIMFHEGSHGSLFISYIQNHIASNPLPVFAGAIAMTEQEFLAKDQEYLQKVGKINQMILDAIQFATITVDCAGTSIDKHNAGRRGYINICP